MLTHGSLFSGVGGCDLGFEAAGFSTGFQVEWDKHCQQVLAYRWPDVPRWSDVSDVSGFELPPVDVLSYGFPCQDLSVAGKRAGLDGDRSGLFFEAVRIIREMREATDGLYPRFAVAENVVGLLNADGGDAMARVLDTLAEAGSVGIEWCVLDAQWFGVPQRRRRVFVTACFDSATFERCPNPLFPIAESSARNPAEIEQERKSSTDPITASVGSGGESSKLDGAEMVSFVKVVRSGARDRYGNLPPEVWRDEEVAPTLNQFDNGGESRATVVIIDNLAVRRLTPTECERLMGWPDDHTRYRADGTEASDSRRYKQCGNGIVAPVAAWIAKHLHDALQDDR